MSVDVVYIAACAHDARLTRICVASVRRFYPDVAIKLLPGGDLEPAMVRELREHWQVGVADLPRIDYGWGFVKLEPLFGPAGERFLVLDSDTVITGPVLERWTGEGLFLVDDEAQDEDKARGLYYDWDRLAPILPRIVKPAFVFNSGQWFGTAGMLTRDDFAPVLDWGPPPTLRHPDLFMPGDQGVLNYVLNLKAHDGMPVDRQVIMRWPGHSMDGLSAREVAGGQAPALVVHWAGMKKNRLSQMVGSDLLAYFERLYYSRIPGGDALRAARGAGYQAKAWNAKVTRRLDTMREALRKTISWA